MIIITHWFFHNGINKIRFDVKADNKRAIRCYEKVGFGIQSEFQEEKGKFYWMEMNKPNKIK